MSSRSRPHRRLCETHHIAQGPVSEPPLRADFHYKGPCWDDTDVVTRAADGTYVMTWREAGGAEAGVVTAGGQGEAAKLQTFEYDVTPLALTGYFCGIESEHKKRMERANSVHAPVPVPGMVPGERPFVAPPPVHVPLIAERSNHAGGVKMHQDARHMPGMAGIFFLDGGYLWRAWRDER